MRDLIEIQAVPPACQPAGARTFSRLLRPFPLVLLVSFWSYLRTRGAADTGRKVVEYLRRQAAKRRRASGGSRAHEQRRAYQHDLQLAPGEWVEVKSEAGILETLDERGANKGLMFLPGMRQYCGKRYRVHKRLQRMFMEESKQLRTMKNTVLLEGVQCDGGDLGCDRSCFYYWREAWLQRVGDVSTAGGQANAGGETP